MRPGWKRPVREMLPARAEVLIRELFVETRRKARATIEVLGACSVATPVCRGMPHQFLLTGPQGENGGLTKAASSFGGMRCGRVKTLARRRGPFRSSSPQGDSIPIGDAMTSARASLFFTGLFYFTLVGVAFSQADMNNARSVSAKIWLSITTTSTFPWKCTNATRLA